MSPTTSVGGTSSKTNTQDANQLSSAADSLSNEQAFLKLLVAQIQYQDPLNPTDSTQFLSQLTEFSQLEQLIQMRTDLDGMSQPPNSSGSTSGSVTGTGQNSNGGN